eukprot:m.49116 g.49116  ORF g.49116 m.49116 type:complete len:183 (-) comp47891_c0_seq2:237-785(-)
MGEWTGGRRRDCRHFVCDLFSSMFAIHAFFHSFISSNSRSLIVSANFPLIAITLRNNLRTLAPNVSEETARYMFPLMAIVPAFAVAFTTRDVELLVGVTGAYAGVAIQYVVPALLCFYGRRLVAPFADCRQNPHRSPFYGTKWVLAICVWSLICAALVTLYLIVVYFPGLSSSCDPASVCCD